MQASKECDIFNIKDDFYLKKNIQEAKKNLVG